MDGKVTEEETLEMLRGLEAELAGIGLWQEREWDRDVALRREKIVHGVKAVIAAAQELRRDYRDGSSPEYLGEMSGNAITAAELESRGWQPQRWNSGLLEYRKPFDEASSIAVWFWSQGTDVYLRLPTFMYRLSHISTVEDLELLWQLLSGSRGSGGDDG